MPTRKGKRRTYRSKLNPQLLIIVLEDTIIVEVLDQELDLGNNDLIDTTVM